MGVPLSRCPSALAKKGPALDDKQTAEKDEASATRTNATNLAGTPGVNAKTPAPATASSHQRAPRSSRDRTEEGATDEGVPPGTSLGEGARPPRGPRKTGTVARLNRKTKIWIEAERFSEG